MKYICLFVCLCVCLSVCPSVCLFVCPSVCMSVCSSACPSVCLSNLYISYRDCIFHLSVCLFICQSVCLSGYAVELREKRKMTKYGQQQSIAGSDTTCIPLVFEHFGFWGPMAEDYLDKISKISKDANGKAAKQTLEIDGESNCL